MESRTETPRYYLGLCAIARDETPFLREWVAYHHYIGFEKIYIYDNQSSIPVRDVIGDFSARGVCETHTLQGEAMQNIAYNLCLREYGPLCEWMAFFDLDEFLCLKRDTDIRVLLRDYEEYSGVTVHWDEFSSSGHLGRPQGMVTQNFTQSLGYSLVSKCIVKPSKVTMTISSHHFMFSEGYAVNTNGEPAIRSYTPMAVDAMCLNHYTFRSQQDYADKLSKADATYGLKNPRRWEFFYRQAASPFTERHDILPVAGEVETILESGVPALRNNILLGDVQAFELPQLMVAMAKLVQANNAELSEVCFALAYKRFSGNTQFLGFGIELCLRLKKFERAIALAKHWLRLAPDKEGYLMLLECYLAAGIHDEAKRLGLFLKETGRLIEAVERHENPNEETLAEGFNRLRQKYSLDVLLGED